MVARPHLRTLVRRLAGAAGRPRTLAPGEALFRTGAVVRSLYLVEVGEVQLVRHPAPGQVLTLQVARAGELLAEASLFSGRYHCDALAAADASVLGFARADVRRGLEADPAAAAELTAHLARQVQGLRARAALLSIRRAEERVLAYLDTLREPEGDTIDPGHPWTAVASEIGLSQEAVYRALARLEHDGRIERHGRIVRLRAARPSVERLR